MVAISSGAKIVLADNARQSKTAASYELEVLLGAVCGAKHKVAIVALADSAESQQTSGTLGSVVAIANAELVAVTVEKTSLIRH